MIDINNYIVEKLKINKDSKTNNFDEINNKFISDIKKYIIEKYPMIKFNSYNEYIKNDNSLVDIDMFLDLLDTNRKVALEKFKDYHKIDKEDKFLDYIKYELQNKLTDEQLIEALKDKLKIQNIQTLQRYNSRAIKELLKEIINIPYISINQLSRVTGINRKLLSNIKKIN